MTLPVGSIVASILSLEDFNSLMPRGEKWVLADGDAASGKLQDLIENKPFYRALNIDNKARVPDLRGMFLRGHNSGRRGNESPREDGHQNPQATDMGGIQLDDVGPHVHNYGRGFDDAGRVDRGDGWYGKASGTTEPPNGDGDHPRAETRPRNVTVNYFIRVN